VEEARESHHPLHGRASYSSDASGLLINSRVGHCGYFPLTKIPGSACVRRAICRHFVFHLPICPRTRSVDIIIISTCISVHRRVDDYSTSMPQSQSLAPARETMLGHWEDTGTGSVPSVMLYPKRSNAVDNPSFGTSTPLHC